jgi:hypothetical protein
MYIFCVLTPAGKTTNRWVSPQAKFIQELIKAQDIFQKKMQNVRRMYKPFKEHYEYTVKMHIYVHAVLSQPCLSFAEKIKKSW